MPATTVNRLLPITLRQLQVFLAIAKTESIGLAAESLTMSKSAVSQALSELETRLGVQLFDRNRGRIFLTAEGRRMMPQADEMLHRAEDIADLFRRGHEPCPFRVGCTRTIGTFMLADLLKSFRDAAGWMPATEIANTSRIAAKLSSFELDIALIEGPVTNNDLVTFPWMADEMVVVAPKDHPLTGRPVSYEELERASWLLREEGSSTRDFFETQLHQRLSRVNVSAELNSFDAILRSVRIGLGITYMSKRVLTDPIFGRFLARVEIPDRWMRQLTSVMNAANTFLSICWSGLSIAATMRGCLNAARRTRCAEKTVIDQHAVPAAALSQCSKKRLPQLIDRESRFECQRLSL